MEESYIIDYEKKIAGDLLSNNHYLESETIKKDTFAKNFSRIIKNECKNINKK
ncbi:MAG: hypothetical protein J5892_00830 [Bacilli bacterium]|nr:hypothetical protein [Bacilli bacterium]